MCGECGRVLNITPLFWCFYALDNPTDEKIDTTYRALFLENDYLEVCVLPDIGGRLFYATDKTNGYEIFYRQHVIKPANVGMLGAWISGGVEWNVFHHHRATSQYPIDYKLVDNGDGSKTIWVGEVEKRHRMSWAIGMTLYPDRSLICTFSPSLIIVLRLFTVKR